MGAVMTNQIQIFLGTQPRLLREMLELALTQLLENAEVRAVDASNFTNSAGAGDSGVSGGNDDVREWLIISAENSDAAEKQARTLLNRHPHLLVAAMANDARSLNVYVQQQNGDMRGSAYSDFSLAQFVDILKRAGK